MLRIALAVVVGVVVTAVLFQLGAVVFLLVTVGVPLGADVTDPSGGAYAVLLLMAALAAVVGGRAARRLARHRAEARGRRPERGRRPPGVLGVSTTGLAVAGVVATRRRSL